MSEDRFCERCGAVISGDDFYDFNGEIYCGECYRRDTVTCECCGTRIFREDNAGDENIYLCRPCYEENYTICQECGRVISHDDAHYESDDDDDAYCDSCFGSDVIHDYSYKPNPIFYGNGERFFGVELEIDSGGEDRSNAEQLLNIGNSNEEMIYIKHDGSLDCGMEIVTHPMSLEFHKTEMPWLEIMNEALEMHYLSHKTNTCGLHVHVNRTTFGSTYEAQEDAISRVLYFVEHHWNELLKFSRRTEDQMNQWATRYGYVKFAVHTNTPHTHFHILVCNTQISDGKQLNMSDSNLSRFKEHCSTALRECGLEPILKLDTTNSGDPLEINEELFPKDLTQEEKVAILYDGTEKPRQVPYYENSRSVPIRNCGNIITVNVIVPFGTQGTMYFSRNGTPCVSFKPAADPGACNTAPQISSGNIGNTVNERYYRQLAENLADQDDSEPDWLRDEPDTLDDTGDVAELQGEVITSPESEYPEELLVDPFIVDSCLIDPFIIL